MFNHAAPKVSIKKVMEMYFSLGSKKSSSKKENQYITLRKIFARNKVILPVRESDIAVNLIHNHITNLYTFQRLRRTAQTANSSHTEFAERRFINYRKETIELWKSIISELGYPYDESNVVVNPVVSKYIGSQGSDINILTEAAKGFINSVIKAIPEQYKVDYIKWLINELNPSATDRLALMDHLLTPSRSFSAFTHENKTAVQRAAG